MGHKFSDAPNSPAAFFKVLPANIQGEPGN